MSDARLPAHLEVAGLIRAVQAAGGFATVLHKGERDAGSVSVIVTDRGRNAALWERMPQRDGSRSFVRIKARDPDHPAEFDDYLARRARQDPDGWQVELDVENPERFIVP